MARKLIIPISSFLLGGVLGFFLSCTTGQNLTKQTVIAKSIDKLASSSSVLSDCRSKNAGVDQTSGTNQRNCDVEQKLYMREYIWKACDPLPEPKRRECFTHYK